MANIHGFRDFPQGNPNNPQGAQASRAANIRNIPMLCKFNNNLKSKQLFDTEYV